MKLATLMLFSFFITTFIAEVSQASEKTFKDKFVKGSLIVDITCEKIILDNTIIEKNIEFSGRRRDLGIVVLLNGSKVRGTVMNGYRVSSKNCS